MHDLIDVGILLTAILAGMFFDRRNFSRLGSRIDRLETRLDSRFDRLDSRFDHLDSRFDAFEAALHVIHETLVRHDARIERLEKRSS